MSDLPPDDGGDVQPDAVVRTALQLLPVPAHKGVFWTRLDREIDLTDASAVPDAPGDADRADAGDDVLELYAASSTALVPPALRRRSNAVVADRTSVGTGQRGSVRVDL